MSASVNNGWIDDGGGSRVPVYSGEFHYFRNERRYWRRILQAMKDAGLTMVTSFVQPNYHEYAPGQFDFEGRTAPERDLPHFLELASEIGLYMQLRLGPACCEWRQSGGSSFGTPWREISDAFWDVVGKYQVDQQGPLLLYQIHNEWFHPLGMYYILKPSHDAFDGFHAQPVPFWLELCGPNCHYLAAGYDFSMDYLPTYLAALYPDVSSMNAAWATNYASFDAVRDELARAGVVTCHDYIGWCRDIFRRIEYPGGSPRRATDMLNWANLYTAAPLSEDVDYTRKRVTIPIVHNWSMYDERKWSKMAHLDLSGYDTYAPLSVDIWNWAKYACDMQTSPFPFSGEFMCGTIERYLWGGQGIYTESFARMEILAYVMGGMKGVNLYMFVERDNWLQCPLDERGGKRPSYGAISSIVEALKRTRWHETQMAADLGIYKCPDYHRYADGSDDGMFDEGYREAYIRDGLYKGYEPKQQFVAAYRALRDRHVSFRVVKDTRGGESLRGLRAVLAYTLWFGDTAAADDLLRFVQDGGALILFPCVPTHGDDGKELDAFTGTLGLKPFAADQTADSHVGTQGLDFEAALASSRGDFISPDGMLCAQIRTFGKGKVMALNTNLANEAELLDMLVTRWGGCRKFVDTGVELTGGGMGVHPDGHAVVPLVNGNHEDTVVHEVAIDVSALPHAATYSVTDELDGTVTGSLKPTDGVIRVPLALGPRDGALLSVRAGESAATAKPPVERIEVPVTEWRARREDEAEYHRRYLGADIDEQWTPVPAAEWTLPAIASGKVYGVQGWFYLKQNVVLPDTSQRVYLHLRPQGYHNLGVVYLNGRECGRFMIERPGAESVFDVTEFARPGRKNTLAVRLYRNSLDCHDRGVSGFSLLRFECGAEIANVEELCLRQERRDFGEEAGWALGGPGDGWAGISLPHALEMSRLGDALWLQSDIEIEKPAGGHLSLVGENCVVGVFVNGAYVAKTPYLPCDLDVSDSLVPGRNSLALRLVPDNSEHYRIPQAERYRSWIQDAMIPLNVSLSGVRLAVVARRVRSAR